MKKAASVFLRAKITPMDVERAAGSEKLRLSGDADVWRIDTLSDDGGGISEGFAVKGQLAAAFFRNCIRADSCHHPRDGWWRINSSAGRSNSLSSHSHMRSLGGTPPRWDAS